MKLQSVLILGIATWLIALPLRAELILHYTFNGHVDGGTIEDVSASSSQTNDVVYTGPNNAAIRLPLATDPAKSDPRYQRPLCNGPDHRA